MREIYIDIVKGLSVLCITLLHFEDGIFSNALNIWIGSFMITAFYFTSGWIMCLSQKEISLKSHIHKRIRQLVFPYIWFTLIIILFDGILVLFGIKGYQLILTDIYKTIVLRGIGTLWFLPALFFSEIIAIVFLQRTLKWKIVITLATILYLSGYKYWNDTFAYGSELCRIVDAPLRTIYNIMRAWGVIVAGYYICNVFYRYIQLLSNRKLLIYGCFLMVASFLSANYLDRLLPLFGEIDSVVWLFIAPIVGPFGLLLLAKATEKWEVSSFLSFWGKNSLILMATHYSILMEICILVNKTFWGQDGLSGFHSLLFFVVTIVFEYIVVYLINTKAKFIIGK
ncbi:MAG: acyltransferase family protein [Candidatus Symbiothrix sp.]|jgi:hypothetical protein|nr:acyltransferase family protein [Candidatus Symbiothrix sp.]